MENILSIPFIIGAISYRVGEFLDTKTQNAIASVNRENGKVQIAVEADLETGVDSVSSQAAFVDYASKYQFPPGISYRV